MWNTKPDHLTESSAYQCIHIFEEKHPLRKNLLTLAKRVKSYHFWQARGRSCSQWKLPAQCITFWLSNSFPPRLKQTKSHAVCYYSDAKESYFTNDNSYYCSSPLRENGVYKPCWQHFNSCDIYTSCHQWQPQVSLLLTQQKSPYTNGYRRTAGPSC